MGEEWGTICAEGFTDADATTACELAGLSGKG